MNLTSHEHCQEWKEIEHMMEYDTRRWKSHDDDALWSLPHVGNLASHLSEHKHDNTDQYSLNNSFWITLKSIVKQVMHEAPTILN